MEKIYRIWGSFKNEVGLSTVIGAPRDYKLLVLLRMLRFASFGGVAVVAARYLKLIGFKEDMIGVFFTMIMLGDLIVSFAMSLMADKLGRKMILMLSSTILMATAFVFCVTENHTIIMIAAIFGFMTPSGNEVGPFRSVEQSIVAHLVPPEQRSDCYAFYIFLGILSTAVGSMASGFFIQFLQTALHISEKNSDKAAYYIMVLLSGMMIYVCYLLSDEVELGSAITDEGEILLGDNNSDSDSSVELLKQSLFQKVALFLRELVPKIDPKSKLIVIKLSFLFIVDTLAKSLVTKTWVSYYLKEKFNLQAGETGAIFFFHDSFVAFLTLIGSSISRRKGVIYTMIVTHVPSIVFNTLIPVPNQVTPTVFLILGRGTFQAMDMSSKHAFVASVVKPEERTAVIAWTNLCRTLGQSLAPSVTGFVTGLNMQWISFVLSGLLRLLYDIGLFVNFWKIRESL